MLNQGLNLAGAFTMCVALATGGDIECAVFANLPTVSFILGGLTLGAEWKRDWSTHTTLVWKMRRRKRSGMGERWPSGYASGALMGHEFR